MCYIQKRSFNNAEITFYKTQKLHEFLKITYKSEVLSLQKGIIYKTKNEFALASKIFSTIIEKPDNLHILNSKTEAMYQIGTIEMTQTRNVLALKYFLKTLELNTKNNNLEQKSSILFALSTVHDKMLDNNSAYSYLKQHS